MAWENHQQGCRIHTAQSSAYLESQHFELPVGTVRSAYECCERGHSHPVLHALKSCAFSGYVMTWVMKWQDCLIQIQCEDSTSTYLILHVSRLAWTFDITMEGKPSQLEVRADHLVPVLDLNVGACFCMEKFVRCTRLLTMSSFFTVKCAIVNLANPDLYRYAWNFHHISPEKTRMSMHFFVFVFLFNYGYSERGGLMQFWWVGLLVPSAAHMKEPEHICEDQISFHQLSKDCRCIAALCSSLPDSAPPK